MPPDLQGWATFINTTGLLGGFLAILYGYFTEKWVGGFAHKAMKADYEARIAAMKKECDERLGQEQTDKAAIIADYEKRLTQYRQDIADEKVLVRADRDDAVNRARVREENWQRIALTATGLLDKMQGVAGRAVDLAGLQTNKESGAT